MSFSLSLSLSSASPLPFINTNRKKKVKPLVPLLLRLSRRASLAFSADVFVRVCSRLGGKSLVVGTFWVLRKKNLREKNAHRSKKKKERNKCPPFLHRLLPRIRLRFFRSALSRWLYSETRLLFSSFRFPRAARAFIFTGRS